MKNTKLIVVQILALMAGTAIVTAQNESSPGIAQVYSGDWKTSKDQTLGFATTQTSIERNVLCAFGSDSWEDYTFECEALKIEGDEGFLLAFRVKDYVNLVKLTFGAYKNTRTVFETLKNSEKAIVAENPSSFTAVVPNKWYKIKVTVIGDKIAGYLDGEEVAVFQDHLAEEAPERAPVGVRDSERPEDRQK